MGKILKFCNSCEEGFAERFTFCPNCSGSLQAVELNPVQTAAPVEPETAAPVEPEAPAFIKEEVTEPIREMVNTEPTVDEIEFASAPTEEIPAAIVDEPVVEDVVEEVKTPPARHESPAFMTAPGILFESEPKYADEVRHTIPKPLLSKDDDGYSITVIEEKNGNQRNGLLLAATAFTVLVALGAWAVSLFSKDLNISSIGDDYSLASLIDEVPMPTDEEEEKPKNDKDAGGGGGGGRDEKEDVNQGNLADQTRPPIRPPNVHTPKSDDPMLPPPTTEGNKKFPKDFPDWGDPNKYGTIKSNGPGTGGGMGTGTGTGQGSGTGTGAGSGSGSGYGGGVGDGNGDGRGSGTAGGPPPAAVGVSQPLKILSKAKAQYTDAARTNNVQGAVTLRVTFLASGGIGSITTIKGLPHGLTEQAIAAARAMRFEPEKVNGVARTTTRPVTFTFNIY